MGTVCRRSVIGGTLAAAAADGLSVYASTRGDSSITMSQADPKSVLLAAPYRVSAGGKEPRFFTITPDHRGLVVANQESDVIVAYTLDETGMPHGGTVIARVGSPSSIWFAGITRIPATP